MQINQKTDTDKYRQLFEKMELGVIYENEKGEILEANQAAAEILGISLDEITSRSSIDNRWHAVREDGTEYHGEDHPTMQALKTGKVIKNEKMGIFNPKLNEQRWIQINAVPEFRPNEKKPYRVFVTFHDITEQFLAEKKLKESEDKFRALFENGPIGVAIHKMIYDDEGNPVDYFFLDANENYQKLTGVDPRGKLVTEAFPGIEKDPSDWIGTFARAGKYGETIRFEQYLEPVDRWYDAVGYQSSPDHFVAAFFETTEQKKKELELERLKNQLEEKVIERTKELQIEKERAEQASQAKSIFLANMSHELRTPLNAVLGYSEILSLTETDPKRKHHLTSIQASGKALLSLVNDVLDLSKIEAGKLDMHYNLVSIREILDEIKTIFLHSAHEKGLEMTIELDKSVPEALILDETRLRQVLLNLVGNALKFTEKGYIKISCSAEEQATDIKSRVNLQFDVEDTGKGIEKIDQERIFNAFEQAKGQKTTQYGGTGLGLAITKNLVKAMNGEIDLQSAPNKGSKFTVQLNDVEIGTGLNSRIEKDPSLEQIVFEPATILITDDIDYNREMLGTYLEPWQITVYYAANGEEAVKLTQKLHPNLVLMDMKMPVMDGYTASKLIKENKSTSSIPIIAITASALKKDEEQIRKYCDSYLRKPISRKILINEITRYLGHSLNDEVSSGTSEEQTSAWTMPRNEVVVQLHEYAMDGNMSGLVEHAEKMKQLFPESVSFFNEVIDLAIACQDLKLIRLLQPDSKH